MAIHPRLIEDGVFLPGFDKGLYLASGFIDSENVLTGAFSFSFL